MGIIATVAVPSLPPGARLGPYEIVHAVGSGAMGDVYKARDTRLGRLVAIKVAKEEFSERFDREARAVAALNSPHICQLYDVGQNYLVMEFVEGTPLGRVDSTDTLLTLAIQIADGLVVAHAAGIIHRDLKPGNVFVSRDGQVKILDFGLATMGSRQPGASDVTAAAVVTDAGSAVGTAAYMSPEQARGLAVDARSDLWSLGVILYEMATGARPFDGQTNAVIFEAILARQPVPLRERDPKVPLEVARIVERLLDKDRETRYQSAADVRADLKRVSRASSDAHDASAGENTMPLHAAAPGPRGRPRRRTVGLTFAASLVTLAAAAAAYVYYPRSPVTSPAEYIQLTDFTDLVTAPALSPDGRMVAFIRGGSWFLSTGQIYVKLLPGGEAVRLTNEPGPKLAPVFTPDGARVAYTVVDLSVSPGSWDTWTVPVHGGQPTRLLPNAAALTWLDPRAVLFSEIKPPGIHMGIVTSGEGRSNHREIYFPAHERAMAHYSWAAPDRRSILLVEMDRTTAWQPCRLVPFEGGAGRTVGPPGRCIAAGWSPDGRWMYFNAEVQGSFHIWRQRYPDGSPEQITFGPTEEEGLAVAPDGKSIVTAVGLERSSIWMHENAADRALSTEGFAFAPRLSPDGSRLYYLARQTSTSSSELRMLDLASGRTDRLLSESVSDFDITRDERQVAFTVRSPEGDSQIWLAPLDRRSAPRRIVSGGDQVTFGPDGDLVFRALGEKSNSLDRIRQDGTGRTRIGEFAVLAKGRSTLDGEWVVAFVARGDEADTVAVAVRDGNPVRICPQLCAAAWSSDGRTFYVPVGAVADGSGRSGRTLAIPVPPGRRLPDLPAEGIPLDRPWTGPPGTVVIDRANLVPGRDPSTYVFLRTDVQRNLYRIPLR